MEVMPNVHRIPGLRGANAYLLLGDAPTLVDAGMPGSEQKIVDFMSSLGLAPGDLARIVITHYHADHIGGIPGLKARTPATVMAHRGDVPVITGELPQPPPRNVLLRLAGRLVPGLFQCDPIPVDRVLEGGEQVDILGGATIVPMPGHTPGSLALHFPSEGLLICGDAIDHRRGRIGLPPKPFTQDMDQAVASVERVAELDFEVLCPGHGDPIAAGADVGVRAMLAERRR